MDYGKGEWHQSKILEYSEADATSKEMKITWVNLTQDLMKVYFLVIQQEVRHIDARIKD